MRKITMAGICVLLSLVLLLPMAPPAKAFDKVVYANADPNKYYVEVDLTNKIITVFEKGEKSKKYDQIVKQFICTIGTDATPTPAGSFKFNDMRRRFGYFRKFDVYAQYWTNVVGGIYFHSILYTEPKEGMFTSTSFQALGGKASHGCIRMLVEDARWLYYNVPSGSNGLLLYGEKDDALRRSLIPTIKPSQYRPEADQYETTKRGTPKALLKRDASFTTTKGQSYYVRKGATVDVVSSGGKTCRVHVAGIEGHIETKNLDFLPNGPKDQKALAEKITTTEGQYSVRTSKTTLYPEAKKSNPTCELGIKTVVEVVGATKTFYEVRVDGESGYIVKDDLTYSFASKSKNPYVKRIELKKEAEKVDDVVEEVTDEEINVLGGNVEDEELGLG
jgi:Uncharacterized protein conserved in bacteria